MKAHDWLAGRERLRSALATLANAGKEVGLPAAECASWSTASAALSDPLMVVLAGPPGSGKTTLASALSGEELKAADAGDRADLEIWKYGFELAEVHDGPVVELYRPVRRLADCEFAELSFAAVADAGDVAQRAFVMADLVLLVYSVDDPWGRDPWEYLRQMHRRRQRPAAVVLTNIDQRTGEEINALVEHLEKTSRDALAEDLPVFALSSARVLAGDPEEGFATLGKWISDTAAERPMARERHQRGEDVLQAAAARMRGVLQESAGEGDGEADCMRWVEAEIQRDHEASTSESAGAFAAAREEFQNGIAKLRARLVSTLGVFGIPGSLLRGGRWIIRAREQATERTAKAADEGARQFSRGATSRLEGLGKKVAERVVGVFGDEVEERLPEVGSTSLQTGVDELARRAGARAGEAAGDGESGHSTAALLGARRGLLWLWVLAIVAAVAMTIWFATKPVLIAAIGCGCLAVVLMMWTGVFMRNRRNTILKHFDNVTNASREAIGRDLGRVAGPELDQAYQSYSDQLAPLRELTARRAHDRTTARTRVEDAIALATELEHGAEDQVVSGPEN